MSCLTGVMGTTERVEHYEGPGDGGQGEGRGVG